MTKTVRELADTVTESVKAATTRAPSGPMKHVPREPTEAMLLAMVTEASKPAITMNDEPAILRAWRAAWDVAPGDAQ